MDDTIRFAVEENPEKEKVLNSLTQKFSITQEEAIELLEISIHIARKTLRSSRNSKMKDLVPLLIIDKLGSKFNKEERKIISQNFPSDGKFDLALYTDSQIRKTMEEFRYHMGEVIKEMLSYYRKLQEAS